MTQPPEMGSIERELFIDAPPDTVYEVVSSPAHIVGWWPDELELDGDEPGAAGEIVFGDRDDPQAHISGFLIVEAAPPTTFSFRWCYPEGDTELAGRALLVTFTLTPSGDGTQLRMVETGFREKGWEAAVLETQYREHEDGWNYYLPRLRDYAIRVEASR